MPRTNRVTRLEGLKHSLPLHATHLSSQWAIFFSVVAKKLGCWLKIKLRRLKEGLKCPLCFTDSSPAKNPAGNRRFFSQ